MQEYIYRLSIQNLDITWSSSFAPESCAIVLLYSRFNTQFLVDFKMIVSILSVGSLLVSTTLSLCPPPGSILPPPSLAPNTSDFSIPDTLFSNLTYLGNTSFAIQAAIGNTTVFQYEHSAPGRQVNQSLFETKIRIASATKLITALAIELSKDKISLEDSITKFIPGLKEELYGDVTVKALADHTSGLGRFVSLCPRTHLLRAQS